MWGKSTYLYGAYSPFTGTHFELELPYCNTINFQLFLDEFSKQNIEEFKIILLDNGAFHKSEGLVIPQKYCPIIYPAIIARIKPI